MLGGSGTHEADGKLVRLILHLQHGPLPIAAAALGRDLLRGGVGAEEAHGERGSRTTGVER